MSDEKVIEITPDLARRVALRRQSDLSVRDKAIRLDEIVFSSRHYFAAWVQQSQDEMRKAEEITAESLYDVITRNGHLEQARHFAAMGHEHFAVLKMAGAEDIEPCACHYCLYSSELINEKPENFK